MKKNNDPDRTYPDSFRQEKTSTTLNPLGKLPKPKTKDMIVLGELTRGTKKFENIQKNTGIQRKELHSILESLEKRGLMVVKQKQGMFGPKVELYSTEKGFKEFYS